MIPKSEADKLENEEDNGRVLQPHPLSEDLRNRKAKRCQSHFEVRRRQITQLRQSGRESESRHSFPLPFCSIQEITAFLDVYPVERTHAVLIHVY